MRVLEYEISVEGNDPPYVDIDLPRGSRILGAVHTGDEHGEASGRAWSHFELRVLVSTLGVNAPEVMGTESRRIFLVPVGIDFAEGYQFENLNSLGLVRGKGSDYHLFEVIR